MSMKEGTGSDPSATDEDDPQGGTIESLMVEGIPVYDPEAMGLDGNVVGVVDMLQAAGDDAGDEGYDE